MHSKKLLIVAASLFACQTSFSKGAPPGIGFGCAGAGVHVVCSSGTGFLSLGGQHVMYDDTISVFIDEGDSLAFFGIDNDPGSWDPTYFILFCYNGDTLLSSETYGVQYGKHEGVYTATVSQNNWSWYHISLTLRIKYYSTATDPKPVTPNLPNDILFGPNPCNQSTTVTFPESDMGQSYQLNVHDMEGRIFIAETGTLFDSEQVKINTSALAAGMYIVSLATEQKTWTFRLMKE